MTSEVPQVNDEENRNKSTAYSWKSTSLEPIIHNFSLRRGISKIALGSEHILLLNFNSEIFSFGDNSYGQLGLGDHTKRNQATIIDFFLENKDLRVTDVECGGYYSAVICENGEVFCWGDSSSGQCGIGEKKQTNLPFRVLFDERINPEEDLNNCISKASKTSNDCCISKSRSNSTEHHQSELCYQVKQISCGDVHALALTRDGQVWSWGSGSQVGHGSSAETVWNPRRILELRGKVVTALSCGAYHSLVLVQDSSRNCNAYRGRSKPRRKQAPPGKSSAKELSRHRSSSSKDISKSKASSQQLSKTRVLSASAPPTGRFIESYPCETKESPSDKTYLSYNATVSENKNSDRNAKTEAVANRNVSPARNLTVTPLGPFEVFDHGVGQGLEKKDTATHLCVSSLDEKSKNEKSLEICESHFGFCFPSENKQPNRCQDKSLNDFKCESLVEPEQVACTKANNSTVENPLNSIPTETEHWQHDMQTGVDVCECVTPPTPSSPSSAGSTSYFGSTDSDSEDMIPAKKVSSSSSRSLLKSKSSWSVTKQENLQDRVTLGIAALGNKLKPDVNLTRLTSSVLESVTGMFVSTVPNDMSGSKAIESETICKQCGMFGICLCSDSEVAKRKDYILAGSDVQVWSWGMGGCGQLGQGDTDDRYG